MKPQFFIIFSLSRCGSTALHRALSAHADITCVFEPDFSSCDWVEERIRAAVEKLRTSYSGIKHVWDPSGFPFVAEHISTIDTLDARVGSVLGANTALLGSPDTSVVFLRRRDRLARILSDLLGQQTDLWGPVRPDGSVAPGVDEAQRYRAELRRRTVGAIDADLVRWYLDRAEPMETALRRRATGSRCLDVWYEDILGVDVSVEDRIRRYQALLDFLGFSSHQSRWSHATVRALLSPSAKLNDASTLQLIPNLRQLRQCFSGLALEDGAPPAPPT